MYATSNDGIPLAGGMQELVEDLSTLWIERRSAVRAPHYKLAQLANLDDQISAYLDALRVAGGPQSGAAMQAEWDKDGECTHFAPAVLAIEANDGSLQRLVQHANALRGLTSALGWVGAEAFGSVIAALSRSLTHTGVALAVASSRLQRCAFDDCGQLFEHEASSVRAQAYRFAGECGRCDLLSRLREREVQDGSRTARAAAGRALVLLGDCSIVTHRSPRVFGNGSSAVSLERLVLLASPADAGHGLLGCLAPGAHIERLRIIGSGYVGDPKYAPWLIDHMSNPAVARIAAEAFVHITGADFNLDQLEAMPPDDFEDGPNDDPDDDDIELPEDIALPWPDVERIKAWWMAHRGEFTPGQKLFLGKPITPEHCVHVLKTGYQRQRIIAAHYRTLIQPGTVLFPTSAPAWRQQRLLATL